MPEPILLERGGVAKVTVYSLAGKVLRHGAAPKTRRERIESASGEYYYFPHRKFGEGDTIVHLSSSGRTVLRLPAGKQMCSRNGVLWDNPKWNPVDDDLLFLLYLSDGFAKGKNLTEIDVFSISKGKPVRVFSLNDRDTPAYGWSADGTVSPRARRTCDSACLARWQASLDAVARTSRRLARFESLRVATEGVNFQWNLSPASLPVLV
jgi:hypothetical protein